MNYSLGYAFSTADLFMNFPYKRLQLSCEQCKIITGNNHRDLLVKKIFKESLKLILIDIIENNVTFWLPLNGNKKCNIHMKKVSGTAFQNLRRGGKWKEVDIIKSMFSGYSIGFYMLGNRTPREKTIYINKELRDKIITYTNQGKQYGDSKYDKTIKDYYNKIYSIFPLVSKQDINRILIYSWKSVYTHNSYGGDVLIRGKDLWCYIGVLKKDPLKHFYHYIRKLTIKLRVLYKRKQIQWDGYYYFALSDQQYKFYLEQKNKRGRPKKYFKFGPMYLYKILDECKINEHYKRYIFKVPYISELKIKQFTNGFVTNNAELLLVREPLKFKDILTYDNEYEFL